MSVNLNSKSQILLVIVLAQFLCTSLWFAGNAVVEDLIAELSFPKTAVGDLTSAIQLGFILGTLAYALLNIADRFSPSKVFFVSAVLAALSNGLLLMPNASYELSLCSRFLTGLFLAGIYPVGMKIAADHFDKDLGKSLGMLVGALVLGTAFPHFVRSFFTSLSYTYVLLAVSILALLGGTLILVLIPNGPFRKPSKKVELGKTFAAFSKPEFRGAAFGYFGHMWELYTFYAFVPAMLAYFVNHSKHDLNISFWSFIIIGVGGIGCAMTGYLSKKIKAKVLATVSLSVSGFLCLTSPFFLGISMPMIFLAILMVWGLTVAADSPMFSTLVAQNAIPELKGSALTLVNSIGFALTIISIQLLSWTMNYIEFKYVFLILFLGPVFGLINMWKKVQKI